MSGLYIHGVEMPTFRDDYVAIVIYGNGTIRSVHGYVIDGATAVHVPQHGRLIDANAFWVEINKICDRRDAGIISDLTCLQKILSALRHAPTIIPESEEGE